MRSAVLLLVFAATLNSASAQSSTLGRVKSATPLRTGPSDQMPACGSLEAGEEVIIHHVEGTDWLAIQPPRGSLSWISQLCVEVKRPPDDAANKYPVDGVVSPLDTGDVKIAAGSMGETKPLNVQRTKIPAGTLVRIIGPKVTVNAEEGDTGWYPIVPPRDDFRYVLRSSVDTTGTAEKGGFTVKSVQAQGAATSGVGVLSIKQAGNTTTDANWPNNALWRDAERARSEGNFAKAEELYFQLAKESNKSGDVRLANLCYERVHMVREQNRTGGAKPAVNPDNVSWKAAEPPKGTAAPTKLEAVTATPTYTNTVYGDGILRRVSFSYNGQKVYALTDQKGQVRYYILPNGNDLDKHVGKWLEVAGTSSSPKEFGGDTVLNVSKIESVK
jgi:uncharacterized protein YraI